MHCRILLVKQDRIAKFEGDLDLLEDRLTSRGAEPDIDNGTVRHDENEDRKEIIRRLEEELETYGRYPSPPSTRVYIDQPRRFSYQLSESQIKTKTIWQSRQEHKDMAQ